MEKTVINFKGYRISKIDYRVVDEVQELEKYKEKDKQISLNVGLNDSHDSARLIVNTSVMDEKNQRIAEVELSGYFDIDSEVEEKDIQMYLTQNGTAILFPYLRAIISMITSLDNEEAILLPTINTTGFVEENEE